MELQEMKKKTKRGAILSLIGVLSALIALLFLIFNPPKPKNLISPIVINSDSIKNIDSAIKVVREFAYYSDKHNLNKIEYSFSDTLERFFLTKRVSKEFAINNLKWYWKKYPNAKIEYDTININVMKSDSLSYTVFLKSKNIKGLDTVDILSEIRLDNNFKIYYLRDFYSDEK